MLTNGKNKVIRLKLEVPFKDFPKSKDLMKQPMKTQEFSSENFKQNKLWSVLTHVDNAFT